MTRQKTLGIVGGLVGLAALGYGAWRMYSAWVDQGGQGGRQRRRDGRRVVTIEANGLLVRVTLLDRKATAMDSEGKEVQPRWHIQALPGAKAWLSEMMRYATVYLIIHLPPIPNPHPETQDHHEEDMSKVRETCQWVEQETQRVLEFPFREEDAVFTSSTLQGRVHLVRALQPTFHLDSDEGVLGHVRFFVGQTHHLTSLEDTSVWDEM